ncbi:type I-E CRISPR-associated protein Cas6/Cse3/CasE [Actinomadura spongiicola]|uniref:type I-E CRISPR-associated protein Cas6/Cse3/CasE n=1 Tax=Actinomadura spongiicola TaxID=2303421 RepID=UPI001314D561|nr:type I-E CRISPR-associated protein Cas6/Cse3/CasE [Actinomadura spongiicola]
MTIWLTQISLDLRHQAARRDIGDAAHAHRRVMSLVPDGLGAEARREAGVLYRLEQSRTETRFLVQTTRRPTDDKLPAGYGTVAVTSLDPLLKLLDTGLVVRYRLVANPTKRHGRTSPHQGKLAALTGTAADQWWSDRATRAGLALRTATTTSLPDLVGRKDDRPILHAARRFDGIAIVTAPDALRTAILEGIGRGKSHGCGMLSIVPAGSQ